VTDKEVAEVLTPPQEEQILRLLQGKCPHNKGWRYVGHSHNDDGYACNLCGEMEWM
jgi:hypothetical protein